MIHDEILETYEIRKSNKQKTAFITYLKDRLAHAGYNPETDITIHEKWKGIFNTRNIIVGNPAKAKVFFTAHYDTCAVCPFPNLMAPTNVFLFLLYQILLVFMIFGGTLILTVAIALVTNNFLDAYWIFLLILYGFLIHLMFGYRNKHTANDNTSGVITITKILEELPPEQREKVCVIYFDNEEKGLFGSDFFYSTYKKVMNDKLLINFDCVGDGEHIVSLAKKSAIKDEYYTFYKEALQRHEPTADVKCYYKKVKPMMFPSDQMYFKKGVGICALKKSPLGMYCARIHTPFDTKCREENILYLQKSMLTFIGKL